jgi:general secretion pathway protein H
MRSKGFTLVELLAVLVILALVMLIMPRFFGGQAQRQLALAAQDLAITLRETRGLALRTGHTEAVLINLRTGAYGSTASERLRQVPSSMHISLVTTAEDRVDAATASIRFFADGSSTGGSISLTQGVRRSQVMVDWLTGRISLNDSVAAPSGS